MGGALKGMGLPDRRTGHRLLGLRIRDRQEIAVRIIDERRIPADRVGQLRDTVEGIGRIERLLPKGIGDIS